MATKREMMNEIKALEIEAFKKIERRWKIGEELSAVEIASLSDGFLNKRNISARTEVGFPIASTIGRSWKGTIHTPDTLSEIEVTLREEDKVFTYANVDNPYDVINIRRTYMVYKRVR